MNVVQPGRWGPDRAGLGILRAMSHVTTNRIVFVLSLLGICVAGYLTLQHYRVMELPCGPLQGCDVVNAHPSADGFGIGFLSAIPTAAFGLAMYVAMAALSFVRAARPSAEAARRLGLLQWLMAAAGLAASAYLTYLEARVIGAWCTYCVTSAILVVLLFATLSCERLFGRIAEKECMDS